MNAIKLIVQIICLIFLALIAFLLARAPHSNGGASMPANLPISPSSASAEATPIWKYMQFQFNGARINQAHPPRTLLANLVEYDYKAANSLDIVPVKTNQVFESADVLEDISKDGWQFVWTDGTNFIVRRSDGHWKYPTFLVNYYPQAD